MRLFAKKLGTLLHDADETTFKAILSCYGSINDKQVIPEIWKYAGTEWRPTIEGYILQRQATMVVVPDVETTSIVMLQSPRKLASGSPMKDVVLEEGEIISPSDGIFRDDEVVLDAELGISMRIRPVKAQPNTPTSKLRQVTVDFDTPRSMDHHDSLGSDSEPESEDEADDDTEMETKIVQDDTLEEPIRVSVKMEYLGIQ